MNVKRFVPLMTVIILISFSTVPTKRPVEQTALNYKAQPIKPKILAYSDSTPIVEPEIEWLEFEATPIVEPEIEWLEFEATAYCPCEKCCGKWAKNRPNGFVYTANGEVAKEGVTIAADWDVLPPGTEVEIEGIGTRKVQDRGGAIRGNRIDIYFETHEQALKFGVQEVQLRIIENVEPKDELN